MKLSALDELQAIFHKLPLEVMQDINKRLSDWFLQGGKEDDPYVHQQLRYAKHIIRMMKMEELA